MNTLTDPNLLFTSEEKERIFVGRTQTFWPENWEGYKELISHELWSKEQMAEYNFKKRLEMLAYAYEHSPFYHRLYSEHGIHPKDVKTEADWQKLPIITKEMYREFGAEMVVDTMRHALMMRNTGGSTGEPCKVYYDRREDAYKNWRELGWWTGRAPGEVLCSHQGILGNDLVYLTRHLFSSDQEIKQQNLIKYYPQLLHVFETSDLSREDRVWNVINTLRTCPEKGYHLFGYAGSLWAFAQFCLEHNVRLPTPLSIAAGATVLTKSMRQTITEAFRCDVIDQYGSNELGFVACEHRLDTTSHHLYVQSDYFHFELVNDHGEVITDDQEGETIFTSFKNFVAPLIRYNQGDRTHHILSPDPLHLPFPRIAPV